MKTKRNRHHGPSGKKYSNRGRSIYDRIAINALWLLHLGCTDGYICRRLDISPATLHYIKRSKRTYSIVP